MHFSAGARADIWPSVPPISFRFHIPMRASIGLTLVLIGTILVIVGLLTWAGALSWFGRLPGDIRIERANMRMYIPLTSMLLVSVVLSLVAALIHRFR